jgi:2-polyprenyl-6-hydroxyphenyl methylase/3-demethylubiquinone-9 3-methyltransferase
VSERVREYFSGAAEDFDAIYGGKGAWGRWVDRNFRRDMFERYRLTFETCGSLAGKTVLDIGCGGGRYAAEFARRGAARVVGLDFAAQMIELAKQHARNQGQEDRCRFLAGDFLRTDFEEKFDVCLAIGVLDYVVRPRPFLEKMRSVARQWVVLSFPSRSFFRTPLRRARYWAKGCPVYFYDLPAIHSLIAGLGRGEVIKIPGQGMDYFVRIEVAHVPGGFPG